jgi:hypothetical protein
MPFFAVVVQVIVLDSVGVDSDFSNRISGEKDRGG